ncbi:MAG: sodium:solute symporter [Halieaceae bacterium]|nr:sodium:solute symporter [Halieaceae bacterium]
MVAVYFAAIVAIGIIVARRTRSGEDLFLAGRSLAWGAVGLSLFASNISSSTLVGLMGDAYRTGLAPSAYEWMAGLLLLAGAFTFFPFFLHSGISTIPEYLEKRFNTFLRRYFSAITIFLSVIVDTAAGLYAGSLVAQVFIPELNLSVFIVSLALIGGLYTAAGGLAAVVYTDVLQAIVLLIGTTALALITFGEFDFSWSAATQALPPHHLSIVQPMSDDVLPWPGLLIGVPILGFYYWILNQYIVQRVLGARSVTDARRGAVLAALLKLSPLFIMMLPGAFAVTLLPDIEAPDKVFPTLIQEYLPVGLTGLVLAGLMSAILSSVDSALNSASTLLVLDFLEPARGRKLSPQEGRRWGTLATLGFMLVAAVWAPSIQSFPGLFSYIQSMFAYIVSPIVAVFLLGFFWKRGSGRGATMALLSGHAIAIAIFAAIQGGWLSLHFLYVAGVLFALTALLFVIFSLVLDVAGESVSVGDLTFSRNEATPDLHQPPFYADFRYQAGLVFVLTLLTVGAFW